MQLWKHLKYGIQLGSISFLGNQVVRIKETKELIALRINACVNLYFPIIFEDFTNFHKKCFFWLQPGSKPTRDKKTPNQEMQLTPTRAKYDMYRLWFSRPFFWFTNCNLSYNEYVLFNYLIVISENSVEVPLRYMQVCSYKAPHSWSKAVCFEGLQTIPNQT